MGRISAEEKLIAVKRRLEGGESFEAIGNSMGVHHERIREWCRKYQSMGSDAFVRTINMSSSLSCMSLNSPRVANLNAFTTKNINVPRATANNIEPIISCGYFVMIVPPMNMIAPHITISLANSSALLFLYHLLYIS